MGFVVVVAAVLVPEDIEPADMESEDADVELSEEAAGASEASAAPVMPGNSRAGIAIFRMRMGFSLGSAGGSARGKV